MNNFEEPHIDNEIVGYYESLAIVKDELDNLFYCEIPENLLAFGETMQPKDLSPISNLSNKVQKKIKHKFAKGV